MKVLQAALIAPWSLLRPPLRSMVRQFILFSLIGAAAFVIDATIVTVLVHTTDVGPRWGRAVSFLCAATFTWMMNRSITFRDVATAQSRTTQWLSFLAANAVGAAVNIGIYLWLVSVSATIARQPAIAVAAGSIGGLLFNFTLSKKFVFRARR